MSEHTGILLIPWPDFSRPHREEREEASQSVVDSPTGRSTRGSLCLDALASAAQQAREQRLKAGELPVTAREEELFSRLAKALRPAARLKDEKNADDLVQETLLKVNESLLRFRSQGPGSFFAWCYVILTRQHIDRKRREKEACSLDDLARTGHEPLLPVMQEPEHAVLIRYNQLFQAFETLWSERRARGLSEVACHAFYLRYFDAPPDAERQTLSAVAQRLYALGYSRRGQDAPIEESTVYGYVNKVKTHLWEIYSGLTAR